MSSIGGRASGPGIVIFWEPPVDVAASAFFAEGFTGMWSRAAA